MKVIVDLQPTNQCGANLLKTIIGGPVSANTLLLSKLLHGIELTQCQ